MNKQFEAVPTAHIAINGLDIASNIKKSGVYLIRNKINGKIYVGSTVNFKTRFLNHNNSLCKGKHRNIFLQRSWDKYGELNFEFIIIHITTNNKLELLEKEQYYIDLYKSTNKDFGYNICSVAGSTLGIKLSEETKLKMSKSKSGVIFSESHKKSLSDALMGRLISDETKLKISESLSGEKNCWYWYDEG